MLSVERLIFAARLRDALAAAPDRASRRPLEAQDRLSLQATVSALTESGPLSRDMADIQLSILTLLPGWPTGLRILRSMAPETGGVPDPTLASDQRQFGAQTSQLASGDPLLIFRSADGSWFHARNVKPPHDWCPAPDRARPLLSACVAALMERYKDDGWRIVAQLAGDSRQRPGHANEALLLAKLGLRMAEWLEQSSQFDQTHPLRLITSPAQPSHLLPAAGAGPIASTLLPASRAETGAPASTSASAWADLDAFLFDALPDQATATVPAPPRSAPGSPAVFSDQYIRDLLSLPGTPSPRVAPPASRPATPFIDLTGKTSP